MKTQNLLVMFNGKISQCIPCFIEAQCTMWNISIKMRKLFQGEENLWIFFILKKRIIDEGDVEI